MKLTRESIMSMEPGRELDALVAEHVMNGKKESIQTMAPQPLEFWNFSETRQPWVKDWKPSTDISAAWEVVDRMSPQTMYMTRRHSDVWLCEFHGYPLVEGNAAPETICKAALLAKLEAEE